jgi:hypothetical protein
LFSIPFHAGLHVIRKVYASGPVYAGPHYSTQSLWLYLYLKSSTLSNFIMHDFYALELCIQSKSTLGFWILDNESLVTEIELETRLDSGLYAHDW